jgi:hypothetical protein
MNKLKCAAPGEIILGGYIGLVPSIYLSKDALKNNNNGLSTLIHEIGEYIISEYSLELSHEQLSVFTKVIYDILIQNKKVFKKLLE